MAFRSLNWDCWKLQGKSTVAAQRLLWFAGHFVDGGLYGSFADQEPEQLKAKSPGELGIILGLDRIPEVKTLRRKLKEMGLDGKAAEFMAELTRRWCDEDLDASALFT